jgi:hypothetical protein
LTDPAVSIVPAQHPATGREPAGRSTRMNERIFGIIPPMTTPFRPDDTLDEDALRAETRYLVDTARLSGTRSPTTTCRPT